jgi:hypothetical protein
MEAENKYFLLRILVVKHEICGQQMSAVNNVFQIISQRMQNSQNSDDIS